MGRTPIMSVEWNALNSRNGKVTSLQPGSTTLSYCVNHGHPRQEPVDLTDEVSGCADRMIQIVFDFPKTICQDSLHPLKKSLRCTTIAFNGGQRFISADLPMLSLLHRNIYRLDHSIVDSCEVFVWRIGYSRREYPYTVLPKIWRDVVVESINSCNKEGIDNSSVRDVFELFGGKLGLSVQHLKGTSLKVFGSLMKQAVGRLNGDYGFLIIGLVRRAVVLCVSAKRKTLVLVDSHGKPSAHREALLAFCSADRLEHMLQFIQDELFYDAQSEDEPCASVFWKTKKNTKH